MLFNGQTTPRNGPIYQIGSMLLIHAYLGPIHHHRRHIDRLSRFCWTHNCATEMRPYNDKIARRNLGTGRASLYTARWEPRTAAAHSRLTVFVRRCQCASHLISAPLHSPSQTSSISSADTDAPFSLYGIHCAAPFPRNFAHYRGEDRHSHLIMVPWNLKLPYPPPKRHLDRVSRFSTILVRYQQTD